MKTQNLILLPLTVYGTPSGNYDGSSDTDFFGDRQKAVGYYRRPIGLQSLFFETQDFVGVMDIQGTLDADPKDDSAWFDIQGVGPGTYSVSIPIKGNFTWIRIHVREFTGGQITTVTLTY